MSEFIKRAVELSIENVENKGAPFGCVIVKDGVIIAEGKNQVWSSMDPTAHAKVVTIRNASKTLNTYDLSECELYTSCFACIMCYGAIRWAGIKKIYYAIEEDAAKEAAKDQNNFF